MFRDPGGWKSNTQLRDVCADFQGGVQCPGVEFQFTHLQGLNFGHNSLHVHKMARSRNCSDVPSQYLPQTSDCDFTMHLTSNMT